MHFFKRLYKIFFLVSSFFVTTSLLCNVPNSEIKRSEIDSLEVKSASAKRIIALSPHSVELLFAIGAGDRIIATLEYADYPEAALKIPRIGNFTGIQIEKVVELQPDLIIAWKSGNKATDLAKLESLGFTIFYSHPQNIQGIAAELAHLGELTGLVEQAQPVIDAMNKKHHLIKQRYQDKNLIRVFYQLWHDPLRTIGPNNWTDALIADCQGKNVFDDGSTAYPVIALENVINKNPEVIIIPHHSGNENSKKQIWESWDNIHAVKHQNIFTINGDLIHRFTPRALDGLDLLCKAIDKAR